MYFHKSGSCSCFHVLSIALLRTSLFASQNVTSSVLPVLCRTFYFLSCVGIKYKVALSYPSLFLLHMCTPFNSRWRALLLEPSFCCPTPEGGIILDCYSLPDRSSVFLVQQLKSSFEVSPAFRFVALFLHIHLDQGSPSCCISRFHSIMNNVTLLLVLRFICIIHLPEYLP